MQIRSFGALSVAAPVLLMAVGMAVPARADVVIYNGGTPDQGGQIYAQAPFQYVAMNFIRGRIQCDHGRQLVGRLLPCGDLWQLTGLPDRDLSRRVWSP